MTMSTEDMLMPPPAHPRDDFSEPVRRALRERAGHECSRPGCGARTVVPDAGDPMTVTRTGRAAHIHAAAPGGARYLRTQTPEERAGIGNGIWLCARCADEVDGDEARFPAADLLRWREEHEARLRREGNAPFLPEVRLSTLAGLSVPAHGTFEVNADDQRRYRDHALEVTNPWDYPLRDLDAVLSFPERVVGLVSRTAPPSCTLVFEPPPSPWVVAGNGTATGSLPPGRKASVGVGSLGPRRSVRLGFRTMLLSPRDDHFFTSLPDADADGFDYHLLGTVQVEVGGRWLDRRFAVPIEYDRATRRVTSLPCQSVGPGLRLRISMEMG
jgi:hypothetical protein